MTSASIEGASRQTIAGDGIESDAEQQHRPPAEAIGERTIDELPVARPSRNALSVSCRRRLPTPKYAVSAGSDGR